MTPASINGDFDPLEVSPRNINLYKQNRLRYVARDLHRLAGVPVDVTRRVLLARGVAKWMRNRNVIIAVKHEMKDHIKRLPVGDPARKAIKMYYDRIQTAAKSDRWTLDAW